MYTVIYLFHGSRRILLVQDNVHLFDILSILEKAEKVTKFKVIYEDFAVTHKELGWGNFSTKWVTKLY